MSAHDHLVRGQLLRRQGRHEQAEAFFRDAIRVEPDDAASYAELALCLSEQEGRRKEALDAIARAIQLEPEDAHLHAIRSHILCRMNKGRDALDAARRAKALDPDSAFACCMEAAAFVQLDRWPEAEEAARSALALDADYSYAANLLTVALRSQGKLNENDAEIERLLRDNPESDIAHYNAGWSALQRNDHRKAEEHFRESLRLDPSCDAAREGLLASFRARSIFYRAFLQFTFFMQQFQAKHRWMIIIGLVLLVNFGSRLLKAVHPLAAAGLIYAYLIFILWVWLADGIGNLFILLDRSARHALKTHEKVMGIVAGGGLFAGVVLLIAGASTNTWSACAIGTGLIAGAIPIRLALTTEAPLGRFVFGIASAFVYSAAMGAAAVAHLFPSDRPIALYHWFLIAGIIVAMACTWLGNIPALRRAED